MPDLPEVTGELLDALEYRYADPRACRICGAPLQVTAVGGRDGVKMACTSDAASPMKPRYEAAGVTWKQALDHWSESTEYNPPDGDVRVLAVVAEVRRLRARANALKIEQVLEECEDMDGIGD